MIILPLILLHSIWLLCYPFSQLYIKSMMQAVSFLTANICFWCRSFELGRGAFSTYKYRIIWMNWANTVISLLTWRCHRYDLRVPDWHDHNPLRSFELIPVKRSNWRNENIVLKSVMPFHLCCGKMHRE